LRQVQQQRVTKISERRIYVPQITPNESFVCGRMTPPELAQSVDGLAHHQHHTDAPQNPSKHGLGPHHALEDDDFKKSQWPLDTGAGQIDGLEALALDRYENRLGGSRQSSLGNLNLLDFRTPGSPNPADLAFSALQYLPYPLVVLNDEKTVVMANDAMGRLLGLEDQDSDVASEEGIYAVDRLQNQTLSQMGIDMLQDGQPVWVTWDTLYEFLPKFDVSQHFDTF